MCIRDRDENDAFWVEFKHRHIAEVMDSVAMKIKRLKQEKDKKVEDRDNRDANIRQLKQVVRELPKEQKARRDLEHHSCLVEHCSNVLSNYKVKDLCDVEEDLLTGGALPEFLSTGAKLQAFQKLLIDPDLRETDKIRLICIYILSKNGIPEEHLTKYLGHAQNISHENRIVFQNLSYYGCKISDNELGGRIISTQLHNKIKRKYRPNPFPGQIGSRWTPLLKDIIGNNPKY